MAGIGNLGIDWRVLVIQGISFLVLFGALIFVAYRPILKILDERSRKIKDSLDQAEAVQEQSLHAEEEIKQQLQSAGLQGQEIIARANKTSDEIRGQAQGLAKKDGEVLIEKARQAINSERDQVLLELRREFADLTILAAGKVIGETLDKEAHKKLIDKVLEESQTMNQG
jgi:F-type H+-transporting ATPase subunit b